MKKLLAKLLFITMGTALVGCGSSETSNNSVTITETGEVKYSGKLIIAPAGAGHNEALYEAAAELKTWEKYEDVEVEFLPVDDNNHEQGTSIQVMGGEQLDIIYNQSPMQQATFVDGNVTIPLEEYLEKYDIDLTEVYGDYAKYAYTNDIAYGIPAGATVWGLFYNKKIFDEAGVPYPDDTIPMTWEEYRETAKKLTSGEGGDKVYGALHLTWPMYWYGEAIMKLGGGEHFYTADGKSNIKDPVFAQALEETYNMMHVDKSIRTHSDVASSKIVSQAFFSGDYGMFLQGTWTFNWILDQETNPRDFEVGLAPMPVDAGENMKNWGVCGTFSMTQTTANKDLAFNYIIDIIRETTKLTSSEIYADKTVPQDNIFTDIISEITKTDPQITIEQAKSVLLNPDMIFVTEKVTGPNALEYETIIKEETELYFVQAQDLATTLDNIEKRFNKISE
ncbi:hypothetical protein AN641_01530 [Candidatus Epulonipiscioides gigas]|nr:hypothetical protein AN641_01530 [Epulopiscium sp. SCG-C07WGA-EpuloA2]